MTRPVFIVFFLLIFISLANAQVGFRFLATHSNFQKSDSTERKSVQGIGLGFLWIDRLSDNYFMQPEFSMIRSGGEIQWENGNYLQATPYYLSLSLPFGYILKKKPYGLKILTGPRIGIGAFGRFERNTSGRIFDGVIAYEPKVNRSTSLAYANFSDPVYFLHPINFEWTFEFAYHYKSFGMSMQYFLGIKNLYPKREGNDPNAFDIRTRSLSISLIKYFYGN